MSLSKLNKIDRDFTIFNSHVDGNSFYLSQEEIFKNKNGLKFRHCYDYGRV